MTESGKSSATPVGTVRQMALSAGLAIGLTALFLAGLLLLVNRSEWWNGLLPAMVIAVLATLASAAPVCWGLRHGITQAVAGCFMTAGLRMVASLAGGLLAVLVGHYPAVPTLILMVVFYFALLAAETTIVVKAIWSAKA